MLTVIVGSGLTAESGMEMIFGGRMLGVTGRSGVRQAGESENSDPRLKFRNVQSTHKTVLDPRLGTCKRVQD